MSKNRHTVAHTSMKPKNLISTILLLIIVYIALTHVGFILAQPEDDYKGLEYCVECHPSEMMDYLESPHISAYSNSEFQRVWKDLGENSECLECHTTAYDHDNETYAYPGISCEACHGPGDTMKRDASPELCGKCHSGPYPTYEEWTDSGPSHGEATCITCHDMHTSKLRYETPKDTCGLCHESHVEQIFDTSHSKGEVECAECHMIIEEADFYAEKQAKTGHSFSPTEQELDCRSCHEVELKQPDVLGEDSTACLSCHGAIHELKLELINGEMYPLNEPVQLCAQCHNERYTAWVEGTHGAHDDPMAVCTECHEPHNPVINQISTLPSIPNREFAEPSNFWTRIVLLVILGISGFGVWIYRSD